jgi:hypothetical protein
MFLQFPPVKHDSVIAPYCDMWAFLGNQLVGALPWRYDSWTNRHWVLDGRVQRYEKWKLWTLGKQSVVAKLTHVSMEAVF